MKYGEKGIKVLVPHVSKQANAETGEDDLVVRNDGLGTVFDIDQTAGSRCRSRQLPARFAKPVTPVRCSLTTCGASLNIKGSK